MKKNKKTNINNKKKSTTKKNNSIDKKNVSKVNLSDKNTEKDSRENSLEMLLEQNRNDLKKNETYYRKKYNKTKKILYILILFICLGILVGLCLIHSYLNKDLAGYEKIHDAINKYKNESKDELLNQGSQTVENYHNSSHRLNLTSAYGDNQGTHPKVLYFENGWNGYKYWMVFSPYPYSDDSKENPHIKVSNDLINWSEPKGFSNPLEPAPDDYEHTVIYYSDPHLVYVDDTNTLECYWRRVDDKKDEMILYRKVTKDGVNWSDKEEIIKTKRSKHDYISPSIIYEDHMYKMWYINKNNTFTYEESEDGYNYTNSRVMKLNYVPSTIKTWHIDVIHTDSGYEMITVGYVNWANRASMNLYYFTSKDNETWSKGISILRPSVLSWDNSGLYRSSFIKKDDTYYVFYSGISDKNSRGIGLSYGKNIYNLIGSDINE